MNETTTQKRIKKDQQISNLLIRIDVLRAGISINMLLSLFVYIEYVICSGTHTET